MANCPGEHNTARVCLLPPGLGAVYMLSSSTGKYDQGSAVATNLEKVRNIHEKCQSITRPSPRYYY
jgi:hypothetical protein